MSVRSRHPILRSPAWGLLEHLARRVYGPTARCLLYEWEPQGWYTVYVIDNGPFSPSTVRRGLLAPLPWSARSSRPTAAEAAGVLLDAMQRRLGVVS